MNLLYSVMRKKEEIITILSYVLIVLALFSLSFNLFFTYSKTVINGEATVQNAGQASICINNPPTITAISAQSATVGSLFTYQVLASDTAGQTLTYSDNTSLFDINQSGYISFTPVSSQIGTHTVFITVEDDAGCTNNSSNLSFSIAIAAAATPEPTPATAETGGGSGGGGGGAAKKVITSFVLSENIIKVKLKEDQSLEKKINIANDGDVALDLAISKTIKILEIIPETLTLEPGESEEVTLVFNPFENASPDVYTDKIEFTAKSKDKTITQKITVIAEIESVKVLFDSSFDLEKKNYLTGESILAAVTLFNLNNLPSAEVKLLYLIKDSYNNILYQGEETVTVKNQISFTKKIPLPKNLIPGQYVLVIKTVSGESIGTSSEIFQIESPATIAGLATSVGGRAVLGLSLSIIIVLVILIIAVLYFIRKHHKEVQNKVKRVVIVKQPVVRTEDPEMKKKLSLLKEGYDSGFIKKTTYEKTRKSLQKALK